MRGYLAAPVLFIIALAFVAIPSAYAALPSFDITILNEQSYPTLGKTWTVQFETTGTGNLTITAVDATTFGDSLPDDLRFLELKDGNDELKPIVYGNNSVTYPNYSSDETSSFTVQVMTPGKHHLQFQFENSESKIVKYAHNTVIIKPSDEIKITASDGEASDQFGRSVVISGDTAIVGATGDDDNGSLSGSAYIFERNQGGADNWGQVKKITALDGVADDLFGWSVAISGDGVIVGALSDDDNGSASGSSYVFSENNCLPTTGVWIITFDCILADSSNSQDNVNIQNNSVLIIPSGLTLTIPSGFNITILSGGGILIEFGGTVIVVS